MRISDGSSDVCSSDVRSSAPEILKTPARGPALTKHHSCAIIPLCCPHMLFSPLFACKHLKKLFHRIFVSKPCPHHTNVYARVAQRTETHISRFVGRRSMRASAAHCVQIVRTR